VRYNFYDQFFSLLTHDGVLTWKLEFTRDADRLISSVPEQFTWRSSLIGSKLAYAKTYAKLTAQERHFWQLHPLLCFHAPRVRRQNAYATLAYPSDQPIYARQPDCDGA
jgi:hypothetical protein